MKDPKESTTPIDSHIIDPVGAIKITQNIEFETQHNEHIQRRIGIHG